VDEIGYACLVTEQGETRLTEAAFHILLALSGRDRHGYEIMQVVEAEQGTGARLGTTTLYRTLRGLLRDGLVEETDERPASDQDDQRRRYYRLTSAGRTVAQTEVQRLRQLLAAAEASALIRRRTPGLAH
jgi:DNA-binding PadR family transcriptional regulator